MQRYEAATMIVKFIENVLHQDIPHNDACDMTHYQDFAFFGPKTQKTDVIEKICDLGIMGWKDGTKDPLDVFRPHDILTEEEMNLIINRYFTGENINSITKTRKIDLINLLMMKTQ